MTFVSQDPQCSRSEAVGNIEVKGKQNYSLFRVGPVIKCFVIHVPPNSTKKNCKGIFLTLAGSQMYCSFMEHDLIMCKLKVQVFVSLGS